MGLRLNRRLFFVLGQLFVAGFTPGLRFAEAVQMKAHGRERQRPADAERQRREAEPQRHHQRQGKEENLQLLGNELCEDVGHVGTIHWILGHTWKCSISTRYYGVNQCLNIANDCVVH